MNLPNFYSLFILETIVAIVDEIKIGLITQIQYQSIWLVNFNQINNKVNN